MAFASPTTLTYSQAISGNGGIAQIGPGTLALAASNNYGGGTAIQNGTLQLANSSALPSSTTLTLGISGGSGTLDLNGYSATIGGLALGTSATANGQIVTNNGSVNATLALNANGGNTFGGIIKDGSTNKTLLNLTSGTLVLTKHEYLRRHHHRQWGYPSLGNG